MLSLKPVYKPKHTVVQQYILEQIKGANIRTEQGTYIETSAAKINLMHYTLIQAKYLQ